MVMRYHWGLAAGHTYSHTSHLDSSDRSSTPLALDDAENPEPQTVTQAVDTNALPEEEGEDPELGFENREDDIFEEGTDFDEERGLEYDEEFLTMHDMYGPAFD